MFDIDYQLFRAINLQNTSWNQISNDRVKIAWGTYPFQEHFRPIMVIFGVTFDYPNFKSIH